MYQSTVRAIVGSIVIVGHLLLFVYGFFFLGVFGPMYTEEALQVILMSTPTFFATAAAAFTYLGQNATNRTKGKRVAYTFSILSIVIPLVLMGSIFVLYTYAKSTPATFGPNDLKIGLGLLETVFAGYLGTITRSLFE